MVLPLLLPLLQPFSLPQRNESPWLWLISHGLEDNSPTGTTASPQLHSLAWGWPHGERDKPRWMEAECGLGGNLLEAAGPLC